MKKLSKAFSLEENHQQKLTISEDASHYLLKKQMIKLI